MKIVGMEIKQGYFKTPDGREIAYNNLVLHTTSDVFEIVRDESGKVKKWGLGAKVATYKIKNDEEVLKSVFGEKDISEQFLGSLIGKNVNIYFNLYGNVIKIEVVKA